VIFVCCHRESNPQPLYHSAAVITTTVPVCRFDGFEILLFFEATDYRSNFAKTILFEKLFLFFENTFQYLGGISQICHGAAVLQAQVPKLCTDLDLSLLYILILGTYSKFAGKINFLALGVCCPVGQSAFRRSRPQPKSGEEIESSRLVDD